MLNHTCQVRRKATKLEVMRLLHGENPAKMLQQSQILKVQKLIARGITPRIDVILIANSLKSSPYVLAKRKACEHIGITCHIHLFSLCIAEQFLIDFICQLNHDPLVCAILCQFPLPVHINPETIVCNIDKNKDIDGFHPENLGRLALGHQNGFIPCTPLAILYLCEFYNISFMGKHVVILGRSRIVGLPLSLLLSQKKYGATITLCHSQTPNIESFCQRADILIVAIGKAQFVQRSWIPENCIVIDVGISKIENPRSTKGYVLKGDVEPVDQNSLIAITPVPGGIGPLTIAMVIENCLKAWNIH